MNHGNFEASAVGVMGTIIGSILLGEFLGYGLHRMMHSGRFPRMSRAHMIHHLALYGPNQPMRHEEYKDATEGRASLGNIGKEWVIPAVAILAAVWAVLYLAGVGWMHRLLAVGVLVGWSMLMFSYLHDRMHLKGFWMERAPLVKWWYARARRLHDIHHRSLNDEGKMDRNFGIGFYFFDRVFRTHARKHRAFNWHGYREALRREAENGRELENFPTDFRVGGR
jgi:sterol desaturase/sphingolipid hydroxylase (fatty acid hydroxylase superfamily)